MASKPVADLVAKPDDATIDRRDLVTRAAVAGLSIGLAGTALRWAEASAHDTTSEAAVGHQASTEGARQVDPTSEHYVLADDEAEPIWFLGCLATIKGLGARTGGTFAMVEFTHPPAFATPLHVHHSADEAFYVLAGAMRGYCGDQEWHARTGSVVWLPRGIPHEYAVEGDETLRTLAITQPAGFDRFVVEGGEPARERTLPPPGAPDFAKLDAAGAKYDIETLGPPHEWTGTPPT